MFGNPLHQQAAGEERSLQIRNKKGKERSGGKQGRSACLAKGKSANSSNASKEKSKNQRSQRGKKKPEALTRKELDDIGNKLEGKKPMCWKIVSETFAKQFVMKH